MHDISRRQFTTQMCTLTGALSGSKNLGATTLDGKNFTSVRMGYLVPSATADVGIMCAAPEGEGFQCIFDNLKLTMHGK